MTEKTLDFSNPMGYPIRDDFGEGVFYRAIKLEKRQDEQGKFVLGELEDCNHGFRVKVYYDDKQIVDIKGSALRHPLNTCPGALHILRELVGCPIGLSMKALSRRMNPTDHCTHWLDLTLLAIKHIERQEILRHYVVDAPDEAESAQWVSVKRNDEVILSWKIFNWSILQPENLADKTLFKGFAGWASEYAAGDEDLLEACLVLQKGYFVSSARRFDLSLVEGEEAKKHDVMHGACFSYSEPQLSEAIRTKDSVRDFTHETVQLLKFV